MKKLIFLIFAFFPFISLAANQGSMEWGGEKRTYLYHVPSKGPESKPLVFFLHGAGGDASAVWGRTTLSTLTDKYGFILVAPNAIDNRWNFGSEDLLRAHGRKTADDVGYISALIDYFVKNYHADPNKVYVTGASNGGMMTMRLVCEMSEKISAAAAFIALLTEPDAAKCSPKKRVPLLLLNGTEDPIMNWSGGGRGPVSRLSAEENANFWAGKNGCSGEKKTYGLPDVNKTDGTNIVVSEFQDCAPGAEVVFFKVVGGGHKWPGLAAGGGSFGSRGGKGNADIDSGELIWNFVNNHK